MPSYRSPSMGAPFQQVLNGFIQSDELPFRTVLTATQIEQAAAADNVAFGSGAADVYSVPLTLWALMAQVVSDQKSCVAAVARVLVLLSILGRKPCHAGTGAYCKARAKLPERFLQRLACDVGRQLEDETPRAWRWHGHRVLLADGSTLSMPDTPANQKVYPQSRSQKPGVGFPLLRWVALLGLASGAVLASAFGPWRGKQTGATALLRTLLDSLRPGDVLVADRYYCSYWIVALALARGVHVVFRKHQLRHTDFRTGRRLGRDDHLVTWTQPQRPAWMEQAAYDALPATLTLREVRRQIAKPGCRVQELVVVTTFLDPAAYPIEIIPGPQSHGSGSSAIRQDAAAMGFRRSHANAQRVSHPVADRRCCRSGGPVRGHPESHRQPQRRRPTRPLRATQSQTAPQGLFAHAQTARPGTRRLLEPLSNRVARFWRPQPATPTGTAPPQPGWSALETVADVDP